MLLCHYNNNKNKDDDGGGCGGGKMKIATINDTNTSLR
jgi:hypothetical protein